MGKSKYKQIYDNIYGYIDFDRDLFDYILKDPFFLRLHNLKQMGLAYYVYPDALHTRYAHSIGVYSSVSRIIDAQKYFNDSDISFDSNDVIKIQLSSLLHDIGHLPLSHTIEAALVEYQELEEEAETAHHANQFIIMENEVNLLKNTNKSNTKRNNLSIEHSDAKLHEKLGEYVLNASDISKYLEDKYFPILEIAAGFKGDIANGLEIEVKNESFFNKQIRNFLHSQLDADRIDYLLRDSGFSGVKTGSFDIDKLLTSIVYDANANYGIDESSIRALEQFFISRFVAYCQIVGNKKVMAFDYMAKDFYFRLLKLRKEQNYHLSMRLYSYKDLTTDVLKNRREEFLAFTDNYFFALVHEVLAKKEQVIPFDPIIVKYAEMIKNVEPLSPVTYYETFTEHEDEPCFINDLYNMPDLLEKVAYEAGVATKDIIIPKPFECTIYKDKDDPIQVFRSRGEIIFSDVTKSPSSLLTYLNNKKFKIYRVYTFDNSDVAILRNVMKRHAKNYKYKGDL